MRTIASLTVAILILTVSPMQPAFATPEKTDRCSNGSLSGRFAFIIQGTQFTPLPAIQAATVGALNFDGQGGLTGADVASFSGQIVPRSFRGIYSVNPDCTATASLTIATGFPVGATFNFAIVLVDRGDEAIFIQTDPGSLFTGSLKRQAGK